MGRAPLCCLFLYLGGCAMAPHPAGRNFAQRAFSAFVLDRSSVAEVEAALGPPMQRTTMRGLAHGRSLLLAPGTPFSVTILIYYFAPSGFGEPAQAHPAKAASALFFDGRLAAYAIDSAIPGDANAAIDETRLAALHQGETTRDEAIALLGPPDGQLLHLMDAERGATEISYSWLNMDGATVQHRSLRVQFDTAGQLTGYTLLDNAYPLGSEPIPLPQLQEPPQFAPGLESLPQADREHT